MRTVEQITQMLTQRLNHELKRPGMYAICNVDLEIQLMTLIHDLKYIEGEELSWNKIREELIAEGTFFPLNASSGVSSVFKNIMPDVENFQNEICSVYARKTHQFGYLDIESVLSADEFNNLTTRIIDGEFSQGYNPKNILQKIPPPSFTAGQVLCYAPEDLTAKWIYFDFSTNFRESNRYDYLRSIRWSAKTFEDGFELTKEGYEETRRGIAQPKFDQDVFIQEWQNGKKRTSGEPLPVIKEIPRESRWEHLWR